MLYHYISLIFCLFLIYSTIFGSDNPSKNTSKYLNAGKKIRIIENKGQWHSNVNYKTKLPNGALFFENNAFTYLFFDGKARHFGHSHHDNKDTNSGHKNARRKFNTNPKDSVKLPEKVQYHAYQMKFKGGKAKRITGEDSYNTRFNYYRGKKPDNWVSNANSFGSIRYHEIYKGVDARIYSQNGNMKYDLIIQAGKSPDKIKLEFKGLNQINLKEGNLILHTALGKNIEKKPVAYQKINGQKHTIPCRYKLKDSLVSFSFPEGYNHRYPLIIDPEVIFSTYSGSGSNNFGYTATYDHKGFLYSGSSAFGDEYPTTLGAFQKDFGGGNVDIAISKYDTSGTFMIYSTLLGGESDELPHSLIVNDQNELYLLGTTSSPDFPVSVNAYDTSFNGGTVFEKDPYYAYDPNRLLGLGVNYQNGSDIIISKLGDKGGVLEASTYAGGSGNDGLNSTAPSSRPDSNYLRYNYADEVRGEIEVNKSGDIFIASCTRSRDFPVTGEALQTSYGGGALDGLLLKINSNLENIIWSSYLGGSADDAIYSLEMDSKENIYVTGGTRSADFPVSENSWQNSFQGGRSDGFITHISKNGNNIINATYFGSTEYDQNYFIDINSKDKVNVYGQTEKMDSSFIKNADFAEYNSGQFISKLTNQLDSLEWSTVFGNGSVNPSLSPTAFKVGLCDKIYITGWGGETNQVSYLYNNAGYTYNFTTTPGAFQSTTDSSDFYLMVLEDDASGIFYSTYMGGPKALEHVDGGTSRFDEKGVLYQSVCAGCNYPEGYSDFPVKPDNVVSSTNNSNCNNAVFKFDFHIHSIKAAFYTNQKNCGNKKVSFKNQSVTYKNTDFNWDFGDGNTSQKKNPLHTYSSPGEYKVKLKISSPESCNLSDSLVKTVKVEKDTTRILDKLFSCPGDSVKLGSEDFPDSGFSYNWETQDGRFISDEYRPVVSPGETSTYILKATKDTCVKKARQKVEVNDSLPAYFNINYDDKNICEGDTVKFSYEAGLAGYKGETDWFVNNKKRENDEDVIYLSNLKNDDEVKARMEINASCQKGVVVKDSVNININENINPELKINGPDIVCTYRNVNYSARSSGFDAPHVFNWKLNGDDAGQGESVDLYIHKNSVLTLTMKITNPDPDKCYKNTVDSTSMDIIRSNSSELDRSELTPKDTTVCKGNKVNFQLKSDIKGTVEWYLNRKKTQFTGKSYVSSSDQEGSNEVMAVLIPKYACDDSQRDTSLAYSQVEPLPDDSVYIKNNTLFSNDDHAQHHWLNCDDNYKKIKDETSQFYIPKNNNSYAVEVTLNGCVDTSECIQITGKIKNEEKRNIKIFPNPSDKKLNIYIPDNKQVKQISVIHPDGRIIKSIKNLPSGNFRLNTEELAPSVYFIKIKTTNNKIVVRKWLKR